MTTVYVDAEQSPGTCTVIVDTDGSGFQVIVPDATIEVSGAQLTSITQAAMSLLSIQTGLPLKLAFFGDSNMLPRTGVTSAQTFPAQMAAAMGTTNYSVFAVGGETSGDGLVRIQAVIDYAPTHVFIDFGVNDADTAKNVTGSQYETNMRESIARLQAKGIAVISMSPIFIARTGYLERQRDTYIPAWRRFSKVSGVIAVDCYTRHAAITMQSTRADFDSLVVDTAIGAQHWSPAGNAQRVAWCKETLGIS